MDNEKAENKAKPMKKRNLHAVNEHFEEVYNAIICLLVIQAVVVIIAQYYDTLGTAWSRLA